MLTGVWIICFKHHLSTILHHIFCRNSSNILSFSLFDRNDDGAAYLSPSLRYGKNTTLRKHLCVFQSCGIKKNAHNSALYISHGTNTMYPSVQKITYASDYS